MKIACEKYKITILKFKPVAIHTTHFCGVIQSKYSSKKQYRSAKRVSNTETQVGDCFRSARTWKNVSFTAVSTKVVQLKSILKAYATIPKGMMGCDCSLLHRQVHEFSTRWEAVL